MGRKSLGLIVNPVAGLGGPVGLKGSDGAEVQEQARALGGEARALERAAQALAALGPAADWLELVTYPGEMGEDAAQARGLAPRVIGSIRPGATTAADTVAAAGEMRRLGVDLLLFAGGDGTARDILRAVGSALPALGIPAGVKMHSAVFGTNPLNAGRLAALYLEGRAPALHEAEVMDIDEAAYRAGIVAARLYGYLRVPRLGSLVQSLKTPSPAAEAAARKAIALEVIGRMEPDTLYILGPGTTTRAIASELGLEKTLIGVDVIGQGALVACDANEAQLLALLPGQRAKIVVTPIGGQGCLFGRGNQQISPAVIRHVGRENVLVVSTADKINGLGGRPLWVDTGDRGVDEMLAGYVRVLTGRGEEIVYRVSA